MSEKPNIPTKSSGDTFSADELNTIVDFFENKPDVDEIPEAINGKSSYQLAVENGYEGSEEEWLESLKGNAGQSAYDIAVDNGFVGTEQEWLESLSPVRYMDGDVFEGDGETPDTKTTIKDGSIQEAKLSEGVQTKLNAAGSGDVTLTGEQTLTNKTISGTDNTFSDIPASAISGEDKEDISIDEVPTEGSVNLVRSGGIYSALGGIVIKGEYSDNTAALADGLVAGDVYSLPLTDDISLLALVKSNAVLVDVNFTPVEGFSEISPNNWGGWDNSVATTSLPASTDGWIEAEYTGVLNNTTYLGLSVNDTKGVMPWDYTVYITDEGIYKVANVDWSEGGADIIAAQVGDRYRLKRTSGVVTMEYYRNEVWTVGFTFASTSNAQLWVKGQADWQDPTGYISNPKGMNLS